MDVQNIQIMALGQSGFRFDFGDAVVYIDPYLSDRVSLIEGPVFRRLTSVPIKPNEVRDATHVLITHAHMDHTDPDTLVPLAAASESSVFLAPREVTNVLEDLGIVRKRLEVAQENWMDISPELRIRAVPAAHEDIERDGKGFLRFVGYLMEYQGRKFYHAGDTRPHDDIFAVLHTESPIDVAFLPVNERNYFRDRMGIVGNMSIREAFQMCTELGIKKLVPMHWDMFAVNCAYPEEMEVIYDKTDPPFKLLINPASV